MLSMAALADFGQHPTAAFWMDKGDQSPMCAKARHPVDHPDSFPLQPGYGSIDVGNLIGQMMNSRAVFLQKFRHRAFW